MVNNSDFGLIAQARKSFNNGRFRSAVTHHDTPIQGNPRGYAYTYTHSLPLFSDSTAVIVAVGAGFRRLPTYFFTSPIYFDGRVFSAHTNSIHIRDESIDSSGRSYPNRGSRPSSAHIYLVRWQSCSNFQRPVQWVSQPTTPL